MMLTTGGWVTQEARAFQTRADDERRLKEISEELQQLPEKPEEESDSDLIRRDNLVSEEAGLRADLARLDANREFTERLKLSLELGSGGFVQSATLRVPSLEEAELFWCNALGMEASRRREEAGQRVVSVSYGPEDLDDEDGAHFALHLVEDASMPSVLIDSDQPGDPRVISLARPGLAYIQVAVPRALRMSKLDAANIDVLWGYGYFELAVPPAAGGVRVRAYAGKTRRDPMELLSFHVADPKAASIAVQAAFPGLEVLPLVVNDGKSRSAAVSASEVGNPYIPRPPKGSVLLGYPGASTDATCILLEPMQAPSKGASSVEPPVSYDGLRILAPAASSDALDVPATLKLSAESPKSFRSTFAEVGSRA